MMMKNRGGGKSEQEETLVLQGILWVLWVKQARGKKKRVWDGRAF